MDLLDLPLSAPAPVFLVLALVILLAPLAAERFRLPGVIGLVVAGVVVGPEGIGLIERAGMIAQLGGVGLLYLMFMAGLELDLAVLSDHRRSAVVFGMLTFAIPITLGTGVAWWLGFGVAAAVLIGSLWASHTLVAYPIIRRGGIMADPSVAASVGATVITDTLALLVLAVVAGYETGGDVASLLWLVPGLALLAFLTLWLLPRAANWFFVGIGPDRTLRFLFVLAALLGSAVVAEVVGIEGIVGAFLAGLALNRQVPNGGTLMQRIEFVGSALFIPIFLVSVGMLVDLRVVFDVGTLTLAVAFTAVAIGAKALAAFAAGRWFGFDWPRIGVMFALSNAQAAATLAATIVGFQIGIFDEQVVNAVLLVILVTVVVASWVAGYSVRRFTAPYEIPQRMGRLVLVPVANPTAAAEMIRIAVWLARSDGGEVLPLHVVTTPDPGRVQEGRVMLDSVGADTARFGAELDTTIRVDRSVSRGVINTVIERDASLVLLGWKGSKTTKDRLIGNVLDDITDSAPCLVAACWLPSGPPTRIVLAAGYEADAVDADLAAAEEFSRRLAKGSGLPLLISSAGDEADPGTNLEDAGGFAGLARHALPTDLLVLSAPQGRSVIGEAAQYLTAQRRDLSFIVVQTSAGSRNVEVGEVFAGS